MSPTNNYKRLKHKICLIKIWEEGREKEKRGRGREEKTHKKCQKCFEKISGGSFKGTKTLHYTTEIQKCSLQGGLCPPCTLSWKIYLFQSCGFGQKYDSEKKGGGSKIRVSQLIHTHVLPSEWIQIFQLLRKPIHWIEFNDMSDICRTCPMAKNRHYFEVRFLHSRSFEFKGVLK